MASGNDRLAGGMDELIKALRTGIQSGQLTVSRLVTYAVKYPDRAVGQRLGYILSRCGMADAELDPLRSAARASDRISAVSCRRIGADVDYARPGVEHLSESAGSRLCGRVVTERPTAPAILQDLADDIGVAPLVLERDWVLTEIIYQLAHQLGPDLILKGGPLYGTSMAVTASQKTPIISRCAGWGSMNYATLCTSAFLPSICRLQR